MVRDAFFIARTLLRTGLGAASNLPLIVVAVAGTFHATWDWKWWIVSSALIIAGAVTSGIFGVPASLRILDDAREYVQQYRTCGFSSIAESNLLSILHAASGHTSPPDAQQTRHFANIYRSASSLFNRQFLQLIRVGAGPLLPSGLVTYACSSKAFIFISDTLEQMADLNKLQLLHEIGHTHATGVLMSYVGEDLPVYLLCSPILLLLFEWTPMNAIVVLVFVNVIQLVRKRMMDYTLKVGVFLDEVYADTFALEHCVPSWLGEYSADELAETFCQDTNLADSSPELADVRRRMFANLVTRVRSGSLLGSEDSVLQKSLTTVGVFLGTTQLLWTLLSVYIGLHLAEITIWRTLIIAPVLYVLSVLAIMALALVKLRSDQIDVSMGIGKYSENSRFLMERMQRGNIARLRGQVLVNRLLALRRTHFESGRKLNWRTVSPRSTDSEARNEAKIKPADVMFLPEELDIYCNKVTLDAYIFHGIEIDYSTIRHLVYNGDDQSVKVVLVDGSQLGLGVKIQWLVRPYWEKAEGVNFVRTRHGISIDGCAVRLVKKGTLRFGR